jgi:hypothetical protein
MGNYFYTIFLNYQRNGKIRQKYWENELFLAIRTMQVGKTGQVPDDKGNRNYLLSAGKMRLRRKER